MNTYRINFNTKTLRTSVHALNCGRVVGDRNGEVHYNVQAISAKEAAANIYVSDDFEDRKLEFPKICACCGEA